MRVIKPNTEIMFSREVGVLQHIEKCGRVCYKSEDKITPESASKFVTGLVKRGHLAVTEHYRFIMEVPSPIVWYLRDFDPRFIEVTHTDRYVISGSSRAFCEMYYSLENEEGFKAEQTKLMLLAIIYRLADHYHCFELFGNLAVYDSQNRYLDDIKILSRWQLKGEQEILKHAWFTAKFICDRGITHEVVRHRPSSFCQESTRYCNYSKGNFGSEITVIEPFFFRDRPDLYKLWFSDCLTAEQNYMTLLEMGATPQEARTVLPHSLKAELVMTANLGEWLHFFQLRSDGAAHPQMREVSNILLNKLFDQNIGELKSFEYLQPTN